jgi:hypothetical protein
MRLNLRFQRSTSLNWKSSEIPLAKGGAMQGQRLGLVFFALGAFLVHVHTTLVFLWAVVGMPLAAYPLLLKGINPYIPGFTPAIGAVLLVVGSLIYGREARR